MQHPGPTGLADWLNYRAFRELRLATIQPLDERAKATIQWLQDATRAPSRPVPKATVTNGMSTSVTVSCTLST